MKGSNNKKFPKLGLEFNAKKRGSKLHEFVKVLQTFVEFPKTKLKEKSIPTF